MENKIIKAWTIIFPQQKNPYAHVSILQLHRNYLKIS